MKNKLHSVYQFVACNQVQFPSVLTVVKKSAKRCLLILQNIHNSCKFSLTRRLIWLPESSELRKTNVVKNIPSKYKK